MTQLFQRDQPIKLVELNRQYEKEQPAIVEEQKALEHILPEEPEQQPIDLAAAMGGLMGGSETTATDVIQTLGIADDNLPMKTILPNPAAFSFLQMLSDYNTYLGMDDVTKFLKNYAEWQYQHLCSHKGKRAEQQFSALTQVKQEEFQLEKEAKGLLRR